MPPRAKKAASNERSNSTHNHSLGLAAPGRPVSRLKSSLSNLQTTNPPDVSRPDSPHFSSLDHVSPSVLSLADGSVLDQSDTPASPMYSMCRSASIERAENGETNPLRIDFRGKPTVAAYQSSSNQAMTSTILASCPLWDVVAILILLLSLPRPMTTLVQFLFAAVTFFPTSTTASWSNVPNLLEVMGGLAGSMSIRTVLTVDCFVLCIILFLSTPAQNIALDLAQVVMAISLSGASNSAGGSRNSLIWCLSIISFSHLARWRPIRDLGLSLACRMLAGYDLCNTTNLSQLSQYSDQMYAPQPWFRSILGLHILGQGCVRLVRRYLLMRQALEDHSSARKAETDSTSQSPAGTPRIPSAAPSPNPESGFNPSTDGRPPGLPPTSRDRSGGKKKRKVTHHAQVLQPFWAAIAKTKVDVSKEYEQMQTSVDAKTASSVDAKSMGSIDFRSLQNKIWIRQIGAYDFSLGVCLPKSSEENVQGDASWYVKINGTRWEAVMKTLVGKFVEGGVEYEAWEGLVTGLAPLDSFLCEIFVDDEQVVYESTVVTQPAPSAEADVLSTPTQALLPSSPTSTLRKSIHANDTENDNVRNKMKAYRKQHKAALDRLQSQMDAQKSKLTSNNGADDRHKQRLKQLENSIQKMATEEEEASLSLNSVGPAPEEDVVGHEKAKKDGRDRQSRMDMQKSNFSKSKKEADKTVTNVSNELHSIHNKRSKTDAKQKDRDSLLEELGEKRKASQHAKALFAQEKDRMDKRKQQELQAQQAQVDEMSQYYQGELSHYNSLVNTTQQAEARLHRPQAMPSAPGTPEHQHVLPATINSSAFMSTNFGSASLPGSRPNSLHGHPGLLPNFTFPQPIGSGKSNHGRKRSSSLEVDMPASYGSAYLPPTSMPAGVPFSPVSSSALLANSTALAPTMPSMSFPHIPGLGPKPAPVGAEKESRRKRSGGSDHSLQGGNGSEHGSPIIGKINTMESVNNVNMHHVSSRFGMVSPPGSLIWERNLKGLGD